MRRLYTLFITASLSMAGALAQDMGSGIVGDTYYRVRNFGSNRYIYVKENHDESDLVSMHADFSAIELYKDESKFISDPATVLYICKTSDGRYDIQAQGTGVAELTGYTVNIGKMSDGTYKVYATKAGTTVYLSDETTSSKDEGKLGTKNTNEKYRRWIVDKIETNSATNYFGIKPNIELNGKYYLSFYAGFTFKTASPGMHVYYVSKVAGNVATLTEIGGEIPAGTPVIVECASADPSSNRLEVLTSQPASLNSNKLTGIYYCKENPKKNSTEAYKAFDASTMRVLTLSNGKLVFNNDKAKLLKSNLLEEIEATDWDSPDLDDIEVVCIPANTCYLKADAGTPAELDIHFVGLGLDEILSENKNDDAVGVYSLSGTQLRATNDVQGLPAGLYIVGGVKVVIK